MLQNKGVLILLWLLIFIFIGLLFFGNDGSKKNNDAVLKSTELMKSYDKELFDNTEYEMEEQTNASLKKFLDLNRYSLCIEARLSKHEDVYRHHFQKIDLANLNKKQRFLIRQNLNVLNVMLGLKKIGKSLGFSIFYQIFPIFLRLFFSNFPIIWKPWGPHPILGPPPFQRPPNNWKN